MHILGHKEQREKNLMHVRFLSFIPSFCTFFYAIAPDTLLPLLTVFSQPCSKPPPSLRCSNSWKVIQIHLLITLARFSISLSTNWNNESPSSQFFPNKVKKRRCIRCAFEEFWYRKSWKQNEVPPTVLFSCYTVTKRYQLLKTKWSVTSFLNFFSADCVFPNKLFQFIYLTKPKRWRDLRVPMMLPNFWQHFSSHHIQSTFIQTSGMASPLVGLQCTHSDCAVIWSSTH